MLDIKVCGGGLLLLSSFINVAYAQSSSDLSTQQLQRQEQRERAQQQQSEQQVPDVRLPRTPVAATTVYPDDEKPCFLIHDIELSGPDAPRFQWALGVASDARGRCLGSGGVSAVIGKIQNALIEAGYVTTRVLAPPQDLLGGVLQLKVVTGRIRAVKFAAPADQHGPGWRTAVPARAGDILNLRDVEQGLENLKRVPTAEADIEIVPGEQPGESDLLIKWQQATPVRLNFSADDSGSEATGKYQGGATVSLDNLLGWHELMYFSANRDLADHAARAAKGIRNYAAHYSMPAGYWLLSLNASRYRYFQTIAGLNQDYVYRGTSDNMEVKAARVLYRDATRKTTAALRLYHRTSNNFIDDTEVEVQRRRTVGLELNLAHKQYFSRGTFDAALSYKHGLGAFAARAAPEEMFDDGTARPIIINADLGLTLPLQLGAARLQYQGNFRRQWARTALVPQDRFAIGGRYTVRGFDGETSLSADRGWTWRNDVGWSVADAHQLYFGIDAGEVSGERVPLLGHTLTGAVLGWRGQWGRLQFDLFTGQPLHHPQYFRTAARSFGFSLNYQY